MKSYCVTIDVKAIEQYFHLVLFVILYKVDPMFTSVDETLLCDHSKESFSAVILCGARIMLNRVTV